ncbi:MAG: metalloregulator ArsR/SmtB family transcription factor [Spirochaetes bacterium]|nr:metalloregulator ArsR/SmtB family transcription factor [Spirochaetota bacterium]
MKADFDENYLEKKSEFLHSMAHPARLKILEILRDEKACVSELSEQIKIKQPNISQHLNILRNSGIITKKRKGKMIFYNINEENVSNILKTIDTFLKN